MRSILMSIQPKWCELIASGKKTIEVRKTAPKEVPFKVLIYCSKTKTKHFENGKPTMYAYDWADFGNKKGKVIGEFICDRVYMVYNPRVGLVDVVDCKMSQLSAKEMFEYGGNKPLYGLHITALKVYDKPRELGEFRGYCAKKEKCYKDVVRHCNDTHFDWKCNKVTRPPQSYMYVETPDWAEEK